MIFANFIKVAGFKPNAFLNKDRIHRNEIRAIDKEFGDQESGMVFPDLSKSVARGEIEPERAQNLARGILHEFADRMTPGAKENLENFVENPKNYKEWYQNKRQAIEAGKGAGGHVGRHKDRGSSDPLSK